MQFIYDAIKATGFNTGTGATLCPKVFWVAFLPASFFNNILGILSQHLRKFLKVQNNSTDTATIKIYYRMIFSKILLDIIIWKFFKKNISQPGICS